MRSAYVHTLIAEAFLGPKPKNLVVDHIDNNKLNNRLDNLQYVTRRLNNSKDKIRKYDLPTGVTMSGKKYQAAIVTAGVRKYLGVFLTAQEAGEAYQAEVNAVDSPVPRDRII